MRDWLPEEADRRRHIARQLLAAIELYGYAVVVPPAFELARVLERGLGAEAADELMRFIEPESGEVAALRPDMTPQIARILATRLGDRPIPMRIAYEGTVVRRRSGRARKHRQIPQVGVELAGEAAPLGDLEVLEVACSALERVGLASFTFELGDAGVARGLLDALDPHVRAEATAALAVRDEATLARIGGDTHGALVALAESGATRLDVDRLASRLPEGPARNALARLGALYDAASARGFGDRLSLNLAEVRGFAYYTGCIFRVYAPGAGEALGAGGRYDQLLAGFGAPLPAVGFALDLDVVSRALAVAGPARKERRVRALVVGGPNAASRAGRLRELGVVATVAPDGTDPLDYARAWSFTEIVSEDTIVTVATGARMAYSESALLGSEGA